MNTLPWFKQVIIITIIFIELKTKMLVEANFLSGCKDLVSVISRKWIIIKLQFCFTYLISSHTDKEFRLSPSFILSINEIFDLK